MMMPSSDMEKCHDRFLYIKTHVELFFLKTLNRNSCMLEV